MKGVWLWQCGGMSCEGCVHPSTGSDICVGKSLLHHQQAQVWQVLRHHHLQVCNHSLCELSAHTPTHTHPPTHTDTLPPLPSQMAVYQCAVVVVRKLLGCLKREKTWTPYSSVFSIAERKYGVSSARS